MWAQTATVRGTVVDADTDAPLVGVNVVLRGADVGPVGRATGGAGTFQFDALPAGRYVLTSSFLGYAPARDTLDLAGGQARVIRVRMQPRDEALAELVVEAETREPDLGRAVGLTSIRPGAIDRVPLPDVNGDLMAVLVTMPGVVSAGDRGGQLFVRGGTPSENLVLVDGIPVYQPFHIVGFYSAFPSDILSQADVYAGGFNARYGGRLSSVIDVSTRNGSKSSYAGAVSLAPFLSSVRIEGPIEPGKVSMLAVVRESVIERVSPDLLRERLPYRFGDQFLKLHAYLNSTSSASFTLLHTSDEGNLAGAGDDLPAEISNTRIGWRNLAVGGRYIYLPPEFPALVELAVSHSRLDTDFVPFAGAERFGEVRGTNASITYSYLQGERQTHFGVFVRTLKFAYQLERAANRGDFVTEGGLFIETKQPVGGRLVVSPGFRLHSFPSQQQFSYEPRLQVSYRLSDQHAFNAAWGLYAQEIIGLNDERDVSAVFTAWTPTPERKRVPRAMHFIAGWRAWPMPWLETSVEGYAKQLRDLTVFTGTSGFQEADGSAVGLDLKAEISRPFGYLSAGYSLSRVQYGTVDPFGESVEFNPAHDRRHLVNVLARWVRGKYALGVRWQYGSGLPFTQVESFFDRFEPLRPNEDFRTEVGTRQAFFGEAFNDRLPAYHRLDITAERLFQLGRISGKFQAGVVNAYDRANIFYYDVTSRRRIDQLPIIPTIGLKMEVK